MTIDARTIEQRRADMRRSFHHQPSSRSDLALVLGFALTITVFAAAGIVELVHLREAVRACSEVRP
jgi:hypothetical protein